MPAGYKGLKPFLAKNTHPTFPGFDLTITDQKRADLDLSWRRAAWRLTFLCDFACEYCIKTFPLIR